MVGNARFADKKLLQSRNGVGSEALEIAVNLIVAKGDGEGVNLLA